MKHDYLSAIPSAVVAFDGQLMLTYMNPAAEALFSASSSQMTGKSLSELALLDSDLRERVARVFSSAEEMTLYDHTLELPAQPSVQVILHITPLISAGAGTELPITDGVLLTIERTGGIKRLTSNMLKHDATRAAGVMAAMLAHEVKNPLSGIRGAAQLLREEVSPEQQALTDIICSESDRIRDLLDQVEIFSDGAPTEKQSVNIHEVLQYVISVAKAGFAPHVKFVERYDPSLPPVLSHRDSLVQLFLNLVKNAAEATQGQANATITIHTFFRSGYRLAHVALPIAVAIEDNGPGIPEQMRSSIFEPLISSKAQGRGLGLAVVSKLAGDLGHIVELDEEKTDGARFLTMLPMGITYADR